MMIKLIVAILGVAKPDLTTDEQDLNGTLKVGIFARDSPNEHSLVLLAKALKKNGYTVKAFKYGGISDSFGLKQFILEEKGKIVVPQARMNREDTQLVLKHKCLIGLARVDRIGMQNMLMLDDYPFLNEPKFGEFEFNDIFAPLVSSEPKVEVKPRMLQTPVVAIKKPAHIPSTPVRVVESYDFDDIDDVSSTVSDASSYSHRSKRESDNLTSISSRTNQTNHNDKCNAKTIMIEYLVIQQFSFAQKLFAKYTKVCLTRGTIQWDDETEIYDGVRYKKSMSGKAALVASATLEAVSHDYPDYAKMFDKKWFKALETYFESKNLNYQVSRVKGAVCVEPVDI